MLHSFNGAGTHVLDKGSQTKTLFGRISTTTRVLGGPCSSPTSQKKAVSLGLKLSRVETAGTTVVILGTTTDTSLVVTVKVVSKKSSPCSKSRKSLPRSKSSKSLRSRSRNVQNSIVSEEKAPLVANDAETILSPKMAAKVNQIPTVKAPIKTYEQRITPEDVIAAEDAPRTNPKKTFHISATNLASHEETNEEDTRYEFLHLLAHSFGGKVSLENIVLGSWAANTIMTLYDHTAKHLLTEKLCKYIDVRIECTLKPKKNGPGFTHHAIEIRLRYKTNDGFIFLSPPINADTHERPTVELKVLINDLVVQAYRAHKASLDKTREKQASQGSSPLWPTLPIAKPEPKEKTLDAYFTLEKKGAEPNKENVSPNSISSNHKPNIQTPALKRKAETYPTRPISSFFPPIRKTEDPASKALTPLPSSGPF